MEAILVKVIESERRMKRTVADYDEILERSGIQAAVALDSDNRPADPLIWKRIYLTEDPAATAYKMGKSVVFGGWPLSCYSSVPPDVESHALDALTYQTQTLEAWRARYPILGLMGILPVTEPPTTACTSCGAVVPIEDTWSPKGDDRPFEQKRCLCQPCFRKEEEAGRAKEVTP